MTNPPIGYYTAAAAFILIAAFAVPAPGEEPAVFAITNAKIVPVSGPSSKREQSSSAMASSSRSERVRTFPAMPASSMRPA